uniref:Rieske domain-containing protein n=1 Tax=Physcomitrium patens TaxID=3218 RepID=A0A7I4D6Q8_PHYPA
MNSITVVNALGLQCSVKGGALPNKHVAQDSWNVECKLARVTRLPRSTKTVFASIGNGDSVDSREHGTRQAMVEKPEAPEVQRSSEESAFNWNTQWYPVAVERDLDKNSPHPATILGRPLAIWWDKSTSKWQVYDDQCPHRLAPLSEGSISEEGHLRCSYHGWTFKGDSGECTGIPQAPKDGKQRHRSKRACVSVYPSMEQQGILWFWSDLSQGPVNIEAAANPPPVFSELSDPDFGYDISLRDLEYSYETLIENLMDPAHVNFAHHKIQGNRKSAEPLNFTITTKIAPSGFKGEDEKSVETFIPPVSFLLQFTLGGNNKQHIPGTNMETREEKNSEKKATKPKKVSLLFLCIPVSPGKSRLIWSFPRNFATFLFKITPPWVLHMTNNLVLDSDMYLLHLLERRLQVEGPENWFKRAYIPTTADAYVAGFRRWLNDFAGGCPDWSGRFEDNLPPSPPKRIILDSSWTSYGLPLARGRVADTCKQYQILIFIIHALFALF